MKHLFVALAFVAVPALANDDAVTDAPTSQQPSGSAVSSDSTMSNGKRTDVGNGSASDAAGENLGGSGAATAPSSDTYGTGTTSDQTPNGSSNDLPAEGR